MYSLQTEVNSSILSFFFFNDTATTEIYTLSLHDALPISISDRLGQWFLPRFGVVLGMPLFEVLVAHGSWEAVGVITWRHIDRKSTRLNSSHGYISYAVFCLKKKKSDHNTMVVHRNVYFAP